MKPISSIISHWVRQSYFKSTDCPFAMVNTT
nr:MAG TPA: hypothetical protein [Caudoviricetes sp.]